MISYCSIYVNYDNDVKILNLAYYALQGLPEVLNAHLASFSSFCNCLPTHLTFSHKNQKVLDNISHIQQHLENKGVDKEQVEQISMDLSPSFIAGAAESFPAAQITFDRFHVV